MPCCRIGATPHAHHANDVTIIILYSDVKRRVPVVISGPNICTNLLNKSSDQLYVAMVRGDVEGGLTYMSFGFHIDAQH